MPISEMSEVYLELGLKEFEEAKRLFNEGMYKQSLEQFRVALWYFEEINDEEQIYQIKERIKRLEQFLEGREIKDFSIVGEEGAIQIRVDEEESYRQAEVELCAEEDLDSKENRIYYEEDERTILTRGRTSIGYTAYATGEIYTKGGYFNEIELTNKRIILAWREENDTLRWRESNLGDLQKVELRSNNKLVLEGKYDDEQKRGLYRGIITLKMDNLAECDKWRRSIFLYQKEEIKFEDEIKEAEWEEGIGFEEWEEEFISRDWYEQKDEEEVIEKLKVEEKERIRKIDNLIKKYIENRLLKDKRLVRAIYNIPIEKFIPKKYLQKEKLYEHNKAVKFFETEELARTISAPNMIIEMLQNLALKPNDDLLILGSKSGYIAALASQLCPLGEIFILEANDEIYQLTFKNVREYNNISVYHKNPLEGLPETAPWQKMLITGQIEREQIPFSLLRQLDPKEGVIFAPIGPPHPKAQTYSRILRDGDDFLTDDKFQVYFGPLDTQFTGLRLEGIDEVSKELESISEKINFKAEQLSSRLNGAIGNFLEEPVEEGKSATTGWSGSEIIEETIRLCNKYNGQVPLVLLANYLKLDLERISSTLEKTSLGIIDSFQTRSLHDDIFILKEKISEKLERIETVQVEVSEILKDLEEVQLLCVEVLKEKDVSKSEQTIEEAISLSSEVKKRLSGLLPSEKELYLGNLKKLINLAIDYNKLLGKFLNRKDNYDFKMKLFDTLDELMGFCEQINFKLERLKELGGLRAPQISEYKYDLQITLHNNINRILLMGSPNQIKPGGVLRTKSKFHPELEKDITGILEEVTKKINSIYTRGCKTSPEAFAVQSEADILPTLKEIGDFLYPTLLTNQLLDTIAKVEPGYMILNLDEKLLHVPWEVLFDGEDFLALKFAVGRKIRGPEPSFMKELEFPIRVLLIGDPSENLPEARREVEIIKEELETLGEEKIKVDIWVGGQVTQLELLRLLRKGDYQIIHYAGHGYFNKKKPEESAWILSQNQHVRCDLIAKTIAKKPPVIVFSNACGTGRSEGHEGRDYEGQAFGIANAFLTGHVPVFIGAFWDIHDDAAAKLAAGFYKRFVNGEKVGQALKNVKREIYDSTEGKELVWASFVLYGNPDLELMSK